MSQLGIPTEVTPSEIARETTLGGAIGLCAKVAGLEPKAVQTELKTDKAQFSRWLDDKEGIVWEKLSRLMDLCGNDAPLLWMLHTRGYEVTSLRKRESSIERENRLLKEQLAKVEHEREVERRLFRDLRAA